MIVYKKIIVRITIISIVFIFLMTYWYYDKHDMIVKGICIIPHNTTIYIAKRDAIHKHGYKCTRQMELSWVSLEDVGNDLRGLPLTVKSITLSHILTCLIPALISNYISYSVWDKITYSVPNFTGCTIEVWESISNFIHTLQSMWILSRVEI